MRRRGWILALGAGLCGGLPACQTQFGKGALQQDEIVAAPAEPKSQTGPVDPPSTYSVISQQDKRDNSTKVATHAESTNPESPYSTFPKLTSPRTPPKSASTNLEAKLESLLAVVKKQIPPVSVDPPPPDPPTWVLESTPPTPYAADRHQPPLPTGKFNLDFTGYRDSVSPYVAPANQQRVAAAKQNSTPNLGISSPYSMFSSRVAMAPGTKPPSGNSESPSPYMEIPNTAPLHTVSTFTQKIPPPSETMGDNAPGNNNNPDSSRPKTNADSLVQQTNLSGELNFHEIHDSPGAPRLEVELDVTGDYLASNPDSTISRMDNEQPIVTAFRCFLSKRPAEAVNWLKRYDEPNQELILRLLPLIPRILERELTRADAEKGTEILEELQKVIHLPACGDLGIGKLCLCKHIKTFGDYEPFPEDHQFQPRDLVWIYAEVRNFTSVPRDMGNGEVIYETNLKTTARITNDAGTGELQLQFDRPSGPDRSRSLRRDYWDNLSFNVPDLPPGCYTLWLKVLDEQTGRCKERSVDFHVVPARGS